MEHLTPSPFTIPSGLISTPSSDVKQGIAGILSWNDHEKQKTISLTLDRDTTWKTTYGIVSGQGKVDASTAVEGWNVFALSTEPVAARVAALLDGAEHWDSSDWERQIKATLARPLFWDLFPGAAIVAVHGLTGAICLIRDVLGYYPLYYEITERSLAFSSSLPILQQSSGESQVNERKLAELIVFGQHYGNRTVWNNIDVVLPGQCVVGSSKGRFTRHSFAQPRIAFDDGMRNSFAGQTTAALIGQARSLAERSLSKSLSGEPFVVQGGGGVDSSVLVALAAQRKPDLTVWSINHSELPVSEENWTSPLYRRLGVTSRLAQVTRHNFLTTLVETASRSGQPLVGPNFVGGAILRKEVLSGGPDNLSFVNGEMCDTIFGGLSSFHQLAVKRRIGAALRRLPRRMRDWILRGASTERAWFSSRFFALSPEGLAQVSYGSLDRSELVEEVLSIGDSAESSPQTLADRLTWLDFRRVPSALHHGFFERNEWYGGHWIFPFANRELLQFGFNLPWTLKYRSGHTKWLWRTVASELIGHDAAFRPKGSFDAPLSKWISPATVSKLLGDGFVAQTFRLSCGPFLVDLARENELFWPLMNIEIWGRLHCWKEAPDQLLRQLIDM